MICGWCRRTIQLDEEEFDTCIVCFQPTSSATDANEFIDILRGCLGMDPLPKNAMTSERGRDMRRARR